MNNINIHNPFIGLRTYEEADAGLFRGRTSSTLDLYHMISGNDVVVLHSESGEGKSSILNAGLFPLLRDERYFPIKVNFTDEDFSSEAPNFDNILYHRIEDAVNKINGDSSDANIFNNEPNLKGNVTIVPIADLQSDLLDDVNLRQCAWWLLRNYTLNAYGASLIPVLIFDQFEEVFTRPKTNAWTEDFFIWLSATLNDVAPQNVINLLRNNIGNDTEFPKLRTEKKFKALFSLRTEYMGELDYWGIQRHHIAVLKNSRYCLKPLTEQEADEILELQPLFSSEIRSEIKAALRSSHESKRIQTNLPTIPAMLLSVVSTTASNNIIKNGRAFDDLADISDSNRKSDIFTSIIEQFYQKEVADAAIPKKVLKQFENVLVDDKGRRVRIKVDSKELRKFEFEGKYKRILEQRRLIKCNQINEEEYVELTHDALAKVIVRRRNFNEINKSRWSNYALSVAYIALVLLGITYWAVFFIKDYCSMHNLVKNQIVIAIGSTPIILCGYKRFTSSINVKERIFTIVAFYFILWVFIRLSRNLIDYIAYPVYFHQHCNVESLIRELILIVFLTLFLWIGCKLVTWKQFIHKLRWPAILGIPIIFAALYPYIYAFKIVIAYILVTIAIFNCSSQVFGKNRNSYVLYIISTLFLILSYHLSYSPSDVRKCCVIAMIAINLIFFLYSISRKRSISISQTLKDCTPGRCKWIEAVSKLFGIYSISVILFLGIIIGYKLNDLYSFGGLIITTPLIVYLLSHYVLTVQDRTIAHLLYTVCLSSVIAIWCAQYVFFHFWATIAIWLIGVLVIIVYSLKLSKQDALKRNGSILKCSYKPIILFGIVAYFMPCILMGYNILSFNNTAKIFNRTEYIKEISMTLLYVRSNDGKIGLMNRKGNMIIPCIYDQIIPNYNTIRDNLWDNNNKYSTDFHGFTLIDDWQILDWELTANIKNGRILTYNEASALYRATCNSKNINTTIEENRIYKEIVRLIKRNDTVISKRKDWTFNYKNIADLKCLNDIDFDSIKPDLSATSVSFQKCYLDTILPNMKFGEYGIVSDVLSPSYSWDKTINEQSSSMEHSTYFTSVISDNVTGEMLVRRELGNRLSNLALYRRSHKSPCLV
jgi:hypothetical protein